jgi:hypothetical protein
VDAAEEAGQHDREVEEGGFVDLQRLESEEDS